MCFSPASDEAGVKDVSGLIMLCVARAVTSFLCAYTEMCSVTVADSLCGQADGLKAVNNNNNNNLYRPLPNIQWSSLPYNTGLGCYFVVTKATSGDSMVQYGH